MPRLFTLDEARQLLPHLTTVVRDICDATQELDTVRQQLVELDEMVRLNGLATPGLRLEAHAARLVKRLRERVAEVEALGVELKDPRMGLVDFRSLRDGREVYLCWRLGESSITYWHELDAGYAGRQPLERGDAG